MTLTLPKLCVRVCSLAVPYLHCQLAAVRQLCVGGLRRYGLYRRRQVSRHLAVLRPLKHLLKGGEGHLHRLFLSGRGNSKVLRELGL